MGCALLAGTICCKVFTTTMMKAANGFTVLALSLAYVAGYLLCFWLLGKALATVNLSVRYAIWAALGIVLTAAIAVIAFDESLNAPTVIGIALIIGGMVMVNAFGPAHWNTGNCFLSNPQNRCRYLSRLSRSSRKSKTFMNKMPSSL